MNDKPKYIFGYGSLINRASLCKTIGRLLPDHEVMDCVLRDFTRKWNYKVTIFSEELQENIDAAYLNIDRSVGDKLNGVAFLVDDNDIENLIVRERYYTMLDVTPLVEPPIDGQVFTFCCEDEEHLAKESDDCYIMQRYIDIVLSGCQSLGDNFLRVYHATTVKSKFKLLGGGYKFL